MKKRLLLDVDEVIVFSGFLPFINEFLGTNYTIDDFSQYYLDQAVIPSDRFQEYTEYMKDKNLYLNPEFLPGAIEAIEKLNQVYDIYICSSSVNGDDYENSGRIFKDKYDFLRKYLPFINPRKYIFTSSKSLIKADIQIDDLASNMNSDVETKVLFPSYHNKNVSDEELKKMGIVRAGTDWRKGWEEVLKILL